VLKALITILLQEDLINFLNIILYTEFALDDECNLVLCKSEGRALDLADFGTVKAFVHTSLDLYAFIRGIHNRPKNDQTKGPVLAKLGQKYQTVWECVWAEFGSSSWGIHSSYNPNYDSRLESIYMYFATFSKYKLNFKCCRQKFGEQFV
jgi:hypothetical protein